MDQQQRLDEPEPKFSDQEWRRGVQEFRRRHPGMEWRTLPRAIQVVFVAETIERDRVQAATDRVLAAFLQRRPGEQWGDLSHDSQMLFIGQVMSEPVQVGVR